MATILSMPKWGLAMKTGLVVEWLKRPGDSVQQGEPIVEIESEKATNEVEAPATGILRWLEVAEGEHAPVGAALAVMVAPGEELSDEQVTALIREDAEIKRQQAEMLTRQRATTKAVTAGTRTTVRAPVSRTRSAGASSTCSPRRPALTITVGKPSALSSTTVGRQWSGSAGPPTAPAGPR